MVDISGSCNYFCNLTPTISDLPTPIDVDPDNVAWTGFLGILFY
jgi:hypothetical protein